MVVKYEDLSLTLRWAVVIAYILGGMNVLAYLFGFADGLLG